MNLVELVGEGWVERDRPLGTLTTYKFGGAAAWFAEVTDESRLQQVIAAAKQDGVSILVLGRGSNVVISEHGYDGLVIKMAGRFNEIEFAEGVITAGAAVSLPRLARACAAESRGGLEFYVGIPGSVGGAVVMNAGGHGSDTAEWLIAADILNLATGDVTTESPFDLDLSYRHSRLTQVDLVLRARYQTTPRPREEAEAMMREITAWRREHQPGGTFNAGSVFKNPPGDSAGRLIDACGLKGFSVGGVSVSERHANFFVADEDATALDVYKLVQSVQTRVVELTGVHLQPEIRFVGDFGGPDE